MRVLIACPEAVPYAKTGGLADMTAALLKEFRRMGLEASLIMPLYRGIPRHDSIRRTGKSFGLEIGGVAYRGDLWTTGETPVPAAYFVQCDALYDREELYGTPAGDYADNALRFAFFSRAVLQACIELQLAPDVIHCNDWQTALVPFYLKTLYHDAAALKGTATVYTIHNMGYQGLFSASDAKYLEVGWKYFTPEQLEFYGKWSFMKAGLLYADVLTTVSETYAKEILKPEYAFGLEGVTQKRRDSLYGIVNGLDYEVWDPAEDSMIPSRYSRDALQGKAACKKALVREAGLTSGTSPLCGVVSRLSSQKGLDLIAACADDLCAMGVNLVVLGRGDEAYRRLLLEISRRYPGRVSVRIGFEEPFAHLIYAGADFLLLPSRYEPCGLSQLIAMRYGTLPVARRTGGLADTIRDYDHLAAEGTGFLFGGCTPDALLDSVKRALCVFVDKRKMKELVGSAMTAEFPWRRSAERYRELYMSAVREVRV